MNYAFYISGNSSRLHKFLSLADEERAKSIKLVVSDRESPEELRNLTKELCIKWIDIPWLLLGETNHERNLRLSDQMMQSFDENGIDYMISFGSHILRGELLMKYSWRLINFHPAILPRYPGSKAIDQAVEHRNTLLVGNTAHFIDAGTDTGKSIMQSVIPLQVFFDNHNDYDCIMDLQIEMLFKLLDLLEKDKIQVVKGKVRIEGADYGIKAICKILKSVL